MQAVSHFHPPHSHSEFGYAGFWRRVCAFAVDYVVIAAYLILLAILALVLNILSATLLPDLFGTERSAHLTAFPVLTVPLTLYFALMEASPWQGTIGKRLLHLCVVRDDDTQLTLLRALARTAVQFIPWGVAHTLIWRLHFQPDATPALINLGFLIVWAILLANFALMIFSRAHQALYDRIAGTIVVMHCLRISSEV